MKAMLLAAGEGRRLRPLTKQIPKPMIVLAGKPILEYNIRLLAFHNIRDIVVNLHHCPKTITDYFGDGGQWNVSIRYSYEANLMGTAGAVKNVEDFFDETFLVMYGDNLTNCSLDALRTKHDNSKATATMALFYREDVTASGVAVLDKADRIMSFQEKPQTNPAPSHWVNAGLMILQPDVLNLIPEGTPADFGFDIMPALIQSGAPVVGYRMKENLWWLDTLQDYEKLCRLASQGELQLR